MRTAVSMLGLLVCLLLVACGGANVTRDEPQSAERAPGDRADRLLAENQGELRRQEPTAVDTVAPAVEVVQLEHTAIEGAVPTLRIVQPRNNQRIAQGDVLLRLQVANWPLEAPQGRHVHVIVDNEPYIAVRDVRAAINLNQLVRDNLGHELAAGSHLLRVFPSRGHHESVKSPSAFAQIVFHYQSVSSDVALPGARDPLLTFSRPKGCYLAGAPVLLDFFVSNITLGAGTDGAPGVSVHYTIDGISGELGAWQPYEIRGLTEGDHTVRLALFRGDTPVAGAFNDTTRTFRVAPSCDAPTSATAAPPQGHQH